MGKITDKVMNVFNGGKDDDYDEFDEGFYDDEVIDDDEAEEVEDRGGFFSRKKAAQPEEKEVRERDRESSRGGSLFGSRASKPAPAPRSSSRPAGNEVCIFKPSSIEDSREITETLLDGKAVVINFEGLHVEISQRIIDFISGSCYALDGNLQKISNYIFIATPNSVDISGDFQNIFNSENGFDISEFKSPLL